MPGNDRIDIAVVRKDHHNKTGSGAIGHFSIVTKSDIQVDKLFFEITGAKAIDSAGAKMILENKTDTVAIQPATAIKPVTDALTVIRLFPNPATGSINLVTETTIEEYAIYSPDGKMLAADKNINSKSFTINLQNWPQGIYLLQATVKGQKVVKRFAVF